MTMTIGRSTVSVLLAFGFLWLGIAGCAARRVAVGAVEPTAGGVVPDLDRIVDAYVPTSLRTSAPESLEPYYTQLRREIIPHLRSLERGGTLRWYAFLLHGAGQLGGREPVEGNDRGYIHLFLEPGAGLTLDEFVDRLPAHFMKPIPHPLGSFNDGSIDENAIRDNNPAYTWKGIGEASAFVVGLLENHADNPVPLSNVIQFLHYVTNPLGLAGQVIDGRFRLP